MAFIRIIRTGNDVSVVDKGRMAFKHLAIPNSGAMDSISACQALSTLLLPPDAPLLEITGIGAEFYFSTETMISLTGAYGSISVNGTKKSIPCVTRIGKSQILKIDELSAGARIYLACGQLIVDHVFGSACQLMPYHQSRLLKNDLLVFKLHPIPIEENSLECEFPLSNEEVKCHQGPEYEILSHHQKNQLHQSFTISQDASTMGYRLHGYPIEEGYQRSILSSPVLPGTVQLLPNGQLVILMRDCQTTGGYPRILQLEEKAISQIGQKKPGDTIRFVSNLSTSK